MNPEPSSSILEWIETSFSKLGPDAKFFSAYRSYMLREIEKYPKTEGLDFHECRDSSTEPDDPESSTHGEFLESQGQEFIGYYAVSLKDGHMENYAEAYATEQMSGGCEDRFSESAYQAIGANDQPWTVENPGYLDVIHVCHFQGKDEEFGHRCASELPDQDWSFAKAFAAASQYHSHIKMSLAKGRSKVHARAYAEAWSKFAEVDEVALNYAACFEKLIMSGRDRDEADWISYKYANDFMEGYVDDDIDLDFEFAKCEALAQAESAYRFRGLPAEDKKLPDLFLKICQRIYPTKHTKHWFDEIETLARSILAGNMKLEDIQRSSYMECLEHEID